MLPKTFNLFTSTLLKELLKKVSEIPATLDYDAFGRIYEYFLGALPSITCLQWFGYDKLLNTPEGRKLPEEVIATIYRFECPVRPVQTFNG